MKHGDVKRTIALRPDYAEGYNNLGCMLCGQGKFEQALARFEHAIALRPDYAEAYNNLGNVLKEQGKLDQAAARYQQAISLKPNYAEAYNSLGNVLRDQGKLDQAAACYEQAIVLRPDFAEVHYNLGNLRFEQGQLDEAAAQLERAVALKPGLYRAHNNLGNVRWEQDKLDQAVTQYRASDRPGAGFCRGAQKPGQRPERPGQVRARRGTVSTRLWLFGRTTPKRITIEDGPKEVSRGRSRSRRTRGAGRRHRAVCLPREDAVHPLRARQGVGRRWRLWAALSSICSRANLLKRREDRYDEAGCQRAFRPLPTRSTPSLLDRFRGVGDPSPSPIFIVGMPRSGSTLVEQILASHPQVHAAGRTEESRSRRPGGVPAPTAGRFLFRIASPHSTPTACGDWARPIWQACRRCRRARRGSPTRRRAIFSRSGLIRLILPNARIIHTMRNPVDTCVSCFSRLFTHGQAFSYDLAELGRYYRWYHELMAHWRSVLPAGAMLDVSYEEVVDNLEGQARRLIDYCGLPWDDRCLSFHQTSRPIETASNVQVRRPLYRSSVARWRRYEAYLQPLLAELEACRKS